MSELPTASLAAPPAAAPGAAQVPAEPAGRFRRALRRFTADPAEIEDAELQDRSARAGATSVRTCGDRQPVCIAGSVTCVTTRSRAGSPSLEAEVYDGTGTVRVVFLGQRHIPGVEAGATLVVHGRLTWHDRVPTIYNPRYELLPDEAPA